MNSSVDSAAVRQLALATPRGFLAFGLGSGLSPLAPGTAGTLTAIPFAILLKTLPLLWQVALVELLILLGIYLCGWASKQLGSHDHPGIVWDEMAAFWALMLVTPNTLLGYGLAFLLFRLFDIWKPWPIRWLDRHVAGGFGIMLDDLLAAVYAGVLIVLFFRLL